MRRESMNDNVKSIRAQVASHGALFNPTILQATRADRFHVVVHALTSHESATGKARTHLARFSARFRWIRDFDARPADTLFAAYVIQATRAKR